MYWKNRIILAYLFALTILTAFVVSGLFTSKSAEAQGSLSPEEIVAEAWAHASQSGRYSYQSQIAETVYPIPSLANSGRSPVEQNTALSGDLDLEAESMSMTLWTDGSFDLASGINIRVEGDEAFARQGEFGEWEKINNVASLFAPSNDPLAFLAGTENVQAGETRSYDFGSSTTAVFTQYSFDLNGAALAAYLRDQMEQRLRQQGQLPPGINLSASELYRQMNGQGSLWLDVNGLPARLVLDLELPPYRDNGRIAATITTDFSDFDLEEISQASATFSSDPQQWLSNQLPTVVQSQQMGLTMLFGLLTFGLFLIAAQQWQSYQVYSAVSLAVILSMLIGPLLHSSRVYGYSQSQHDAYLEQQERTEEGAAQRAAREEYLGTDWNPQVSPLERVELGLETAVKPISSNKLAPAPDNTIDSDGDGLSDGAEAIYETCDGVTAGGFCAGVADPTDTDADGLSDGLEVNSLGTDPTRDDSDRDGILDSLEIGGFVDGNGVTWYLNPDDEDSNKDGLIDSAECPAWNVAFSDSYNPAAVCPDSDNDGTPDLFDNDNDDDGVPDRVDMSPFAGGSQIYDRTNPFALQIDNAALDKPLYVEVQIRPNTTQHLSLYKHVLDWPTNDTAGQIQRRLDTTWADTANVEARSNDANAANGDIRLLPMLEIRMPHEADHYANLPITTTAPANRDLGQSPDTWLDDSQIDPFAISITQENDGMLSTMVPLSVVRDETDGPRAFTGRMFYRPAQGENGRADWGAAHQMRLVWLVQILTDECVNPSADPVTCTRQDVSSTIHVYYDDFTLSGLNISEELGLETAVLYENPALDSDLTLDDQLTVTSLNMANTFLRARDCDSFVNNSCVGDGNRDVTIANLATSVAGWFTDNDYTVVETFSYEHEAQLAQMVSEEGTRILNDTFTSYVEQAVPTLMYAYETVSRNFNLNELATATGSLTTVDLNPTAVLEVTKAGMSWTPYQYLGGEWQAYETTSYLELLEFRLAQQAYFQSADDSEDSLEEATGKIVFAQLYYASMVQGISALLELGDDSPYAPSTDVPETNYEPLLASGLSGGFVTVVLWFANPIAIKFMAAIGLATSYSSSTANAVAQILYDVFGSVNPLTAVLVVAAIVGITLLAIGYFTNNEKIFRIGEIIMASVTIAVVTVYIILFIVAMKVAAASAQAGALASTMLAAGEPFKATGAIGALVGVLLAWGFAAYEILSKGLSGIEASVVVSIALALTVVVLVLFLLSFVGLGILGLLLLLIDAIFLIAGKKGPTEYLVQYLAQFFYDVDMLITNMDSSERLDVQVDELAYVDPELGFAAGNELLISVSVTNTLRYRKSFSFNEAAENTTFRYFLENDERDHHLPLRAGEMKNEWDKLGHRAMQVAGTVTMTAEIPSEGGLNYNLPIYLNESFVTSYRGCWFGILGNTEGCNYERVRNTAHINIGDTLYFDLLPATVGQFATLEWGGFGTLEFPAQHDLDGDGLTRTDGTDPNDSSYDTDGDTLSDFYELANGLNPLSADSDGDGLLDPEELRFDTDPLLFDSDNDGLSDKVEAVDGWLVSYNDGTGTKTFRVWSDPNIADADNDNLSDLQEYSFEFHPYVSTDPNAIANVVQIDELGVNETAVFLAPTLQFKFEEEAGSDVLNDSVGSLVATCSATLGECPVAGEAGRFGAGLDFDGSNDYLSTEAPFDPSTLDAFTIAAWVRPNGGGFQAIAYGQTGSRVWLGVNGREFFSDLNQSREYAPVHRMTLNQWNHIVVAWDGGNSLSYYLNGVKQEGASRSGINSSSGVMTIGGIERADGAKIWRYRGGLDELVFYDRLLGDAEIAELMTGYVNQNDLIVQAGADLSYEATITNTPVTQSVDGYLFGETDYLSPTLETPAVYFSFDQESYVTTLIEGLSGGSFGATCIEDGSCPNLNSGGRIGGGVQFNGTNDYLSIPNISQGIIEDNSAPLASDEKQTIAFWIRPNSFPSSGKTAVILDTDSNAEGITALGAVDLALDEDGHLLVSFGGTMADSTPQGDTAMHRSINPLSLNSWQHVVITYLRLDFSQPLIKIFVNEVQDSAARLTNTTAPDSLFIGPGRIGNSMEGDSPLHAQIDELVFYNEDTMSPEETNINRLNLISGGNYYPGLGTNVGTSYPSYLLQFSETNSNRPRGVINAMTRGEAAFCSGNRCPGASASGQVGEALQLDGSNDYLTMSSVLDPGTQPFTVMAWVYADTQNGIILEQADGSGTGRTWLGLQGSNNLFANIGGTTVQSSTALGTGQWHHVAVTYDGSTTRLYVDGQPAGQASANAEASNGNLFIGASQTPNNYFDGRIDDLLIILTASSQAAIQSVMNHSYPAIIITDPFLEFEIDPTPEAQGTIYEALALGDTEYRVTADLVNEPTDPCSGATCPEILLDSGIGESLRFDGVDDWLSIGRTSFGNPVIISFWMKRDGNPATNETIISGLEASSPFRYGLTVQVTPSGVIDFRHKRFADGSDLLSIAGSTIVTDGEWHHVMIAGRQPSPPNQTSTFVANLYVDGALQQSVSHNTVSIESLDFSVGRLRASDPNSYFEGELDELSITNEDTGTVVGSSALAILTERPSSAELNTISTTLSGTATVDANAGSGQHRFEEIVEAAVQPQQTIPFPVVDDRASDLRVLASFEEAPNVNFFQNLISSEEDFVCDQCPRSGLRGMIDRALLFNGLNDYLSGPTLSLNNGTTIAAWVKADRGTIAAIDEEIILEFDGLRVVQDDEDYSRVAATLPENEWVHVAATYNRATGAMAVYVNGVPVGSVTGDSGMDGRNLFVGSNQSFNNVLNGYLDDLRIYNGVLSAAEVQTLFETSAPVLRFEFDEESTATIFGDSSPNGFIGVPYASSSYDATLDEVVVTYNPMPGTDGQIGNTGLFQRTLGMTVDPVDDSALDLNELTLMMWLRPEATHNSTTYLVTKDQPGTNGGFQFRLPADSTRLFFQPRLDNCLNLMPSLESTTELPLNIWSHVAVTFDGNMAKLFINGQEEVSTSYGNINLCQNDARVNIGRNFLGEMDEFALYGRSLSDSELLSIYLREQRWYRARATQTITVDNDAPTIELLSDASYRQNGYIQLAVFTTDLWSYTDLFEIGIKSPYESEFRWQGAVPCADAQGQVYCPVFDTSELDGEGEYQLQFRAIDAAGNSTTSSIYAIYADALAPTVSAIGFSGEWRELIDDASDALQWTLPVTVTVADQDLPGSIAGSGVYSGSVTFGLYDEVTGELIGNGSVQQMNAAGGDSYTVNYVIFGERPNGRYQAIVRAEDNVGNAVEQQIGTIIELDAQPSLAVSYTSLLPQQPISGSMVISGTVGELATFGGKLASFSFEQANGATTFYDGSIGQADATCMGTGCPTVTASPFGTGLTFDGVDDAVIIPNVLNPISDTFSISLWVNIDSSGTSERLLVQQNDGTGTGRSILYLDDANQLRSRLGGVWHNSLMVVPTDVWHHVGLTFDGSALKFYLDGQPGYETAVLAESADGPFYLGSNRASSEFFLGQMDEITFYDGALDETAVYALAQSGGQGVGSVEVGYQLINFATLSETVEITADFWLPATINNSGSSQSSWSFSEHDTSLEGFYAVHLRSSDVANNSSNASTVWRGLIDRVPPQISGASGQQTWANGLPVTEYSFIFTDLVLDSSSMVQPCGAGELTTLNTNDANLPSNGMPHEISATCTVTGHETSRELKVCDRVGLCTTETISPTAAGATTSLTVASRLQGRSDHSGSRVITFYQGSPLTVTATYTVTASAGGDVTLGGLTAGSYTVTLKADSYLQALGSVTLTDNNSSGLNLGMLLAGDASGDNVVNIADLSMLAGAYNSSSGAGNFVETADFNNDGVINIADLSLLAGNYNQTGAMP